MNVHLRPGCPADAHDAGVICHDAFEAISTRHGFPKDFPSREAAIGFVPTRNAALFRWCLEQRLRVVMPMTLMTTGPYSDGRVPAVDPLLSAAPRRFAAGNGVRADS